VNSEFSAEQVTTRVLAHLERRRAEIVDEEERVKAEVTVALEPIRREYEEAQLPRVYFDGLSAEIAAIVPAAWRAMAKPFTDGERKDFGMWRGGDPIARITYVFLGLAIGGLCVELPFIPIWEKWFPFLLGGLSWWLPDLQLRWHRRRYARALGGIVTRLAGAQPALEGRVTTEELLLSDGEKRP
jgi:hypothetical protein